MDQFVMFPVNENGVFWQPKVVGQTINDAMSRPFPFRKRHISVQSGNIICRQEQDNVHMDPHDRDKRPSEQAIEKQDKTVQIRSCPSCGYSHTGAATICPHDGAHLRLVHEYSAHSFSGHYQLISEIGSGGMGLVYKAKHLALNRLVAIKMMHAHKLVGPGVRRFQQEAQAVSHLNIPI